MALATIAPAIYGFLLGSLNYDPVADLAQVTLVGACDALGALSLADCSVPPR